eukprot:scaffold22984_cov187-Isochrysis_galbana.AAC.1
MIILSSSHAESQACYVPRALSPGRQRRRDRWRKARLGTEWGPPLTLTLTLQILRCSTDVALWYSGKSSLKDVPTAFVNQ